MKLLSDLTTAEVQSYMSKGWLTHDAMWLQNAYLTIDTKSANRLNKAAVKSLAPLEMERTKEILGCTHNPVNIDELLLYLNTTLKLLMPPSFLEQFNVFYYAKNAIKWKWENHQCFAYIGMKRSDTLEQYECGVLFRIECWLKELDVWINTQPGIEGCLMRENGCCEGVFTVQFPNEENHA